MVLKSHSLQVYIHMCVCVYVYVCVCVCECAWCGGVSSTYFCPVIFGVNTEYFCCSCARLNKYQLRTQFFFSFGKCSFFFFFSFLNLSFVFRLFFKFIHSPFPLFSLFLRLLPPTIPLPPSPLSHISTVHACVKYFIPANITLKRIV